MRLPDLPLSPKQARSVAEAEARLNIWQGSVRSGKTISSLLRWLIYVADPPTGPGVLVVVGKTLDTVYRNVFGPLMEPSLFGPLAKRVKYTRGASTATILGRPIEVITANDARAEASYGRSSANLIPVLIPFLTFPITLDLRGHAASVSPAPALAITNARARAAPSERPGPLSRPVRYSPRNRCSPACSRPSCAVRA
jgi:hypothetical protein